MAVEELFERCGEKGAGVLDEHEGAVEAGGAGC